MRGSSGGVHSVFMLSLHKYLAPLKRCYLCFDACTENATHFDETIIPVTVLIYHFWSQTMYVAKATLQTHGKQTNKQMKEEKRLAPWLCVAIKSDVEGFRHSRIHKTKYILCDWVCESTWANCIIIFFIILARFCACVWLFPTNHFEPHLCPHFFHCFVHFFHIFFPLVSLPLPCMIYFVTIYL